MKRLLSFVIAVVIVAVSGCNDKDVDELKARVETLETVTIESLKGQIQQMSTSLGEYKSTQDQLSGYVTNLQGRVSTLEGQDYDGLKSQVDDLKDRADAFDESLTNLQSYVDQKGGDLMQWVKDYYTTLELFNGLKSTVTGIETSITTIISRLNGLDETTAGIAQDLEEATGQLTTDLASCREDIDGLISAIQDLGTVVSSLYDVIQDLIYAVQSVVVVPDYSDGSVKITDGEENVIRFEVYPLEAAQDLADIGASAFSLDFVETEVKASALTNIPVSSVSFDEEFILIVVDGSNLPEEIKNGDKSANARLRISDGNITRSSEYFQLCYTPEEAGAFFTDDYTSPFKTYLGKTDEEIQEKLNGIWNHYFKGDYNSKVYYDNGTEAYILDTSENNVNAKGMAYGMMICVQTNHWEEFGKLWEWAKNHMWNKGGEWDGYFAGIRGTSGSGGDDVVYPEAEMYFMASLLFAAHRWDNAQLKEDAQYILDKMWGNSYHKLFNETSNIITYMLFGYDVNVTSPAYDLPAFLELFSRWSTSNQDKWKETLSATRTHLYLSSNPQSGLFPYVNDFNGTPKSLTYNYSSVKYSNDTVHSAMNFGMDYYLFRADDARQKEMAKRIIDFFEADGYQHSSFNWDGSSPAESYTNNQTGCNAVACYALMGEDGYEEIIKNNLQKAWDAQFSTGQYRYRDMIFYLAMLHLCGSFHIWKPQE